MHIDKHDLFISFRRTFVPLAMGYISANGLATFLPLVVVQDWLVVVTAGVYYAFFRTLELRFPFFGLFLGAREIPTYSNAESERQAFEDFIEAVRSFDE
jgi:hypothetical protein